MLWVEAYQRFSRINDSGRHLWLSFMPALVLAAVLGPLQLPLAWSMARRLRTGQEEREALLRKALEASDSDERRRIARERSSRRGRAGARGSVVLAFAAAERAASSGDRSVEEALRKAADAYSREHARAPIAARGDLPGEPP